MSDDERVNRQLVGYVAVDSGQCVIGDPCYIFGQDWDDIHAKFDLTQDAEQLTDANGMELGVRVHTGMGDGTYPVYVTMVRDCTGYIRIAAAHIEFIP